MLDEIDHLKSGLSTLEDQLEREKATSALYYQRSKDQSKDLQALQRGWDSNPFISVLIDGDCMNVS